MANDLKGQLGALFRSTLRQLDGVREVVVQRTRAGRMQLDVTLLKRQRRDALAELGEAVVRLARSGALDEDQHPELGAPLARLEALEEKIARDEHRARMARAGVPATAHGEDPDDDGGDPAGEVGAAHDADVWRRAARAADDREEYDDRDAAEPEDVVVEEAPPPPPSPRRAKRSR